MIWFYLDGEDSRDHGIYLRTVPEIISAEPDLEFIPIPGRAGSLTMDYGGYKDIAITLECYVKDIAAIGQVYRFMSGYHSMVLSSDPFRSYRATFYGQAQAVQLVRNMDSWEFSAPVRLKPFRYFEPASDPVTITSSGSGITNPGSAPAAPRISIFGSGDITLMIGQYVMEFEGISGGIIIDSDQMKLLNIDGISRNLNQDIDEFPMLEPGANYMQWTGSITSIEIEPRWRDR